MFKNDLLRLFLFCFILSEFTNLIICVKNYENDDDVLESWINYQCNITECKGKNPLLQVVYVRSSQNVSTNESKPIYHFLSTSFNGTAGFFVVSTKKNESKLSIDYPKLISNKSAGSVNFINGNKSDNTVGVLINQIFFWNDTKLNGEFSDKVEKIFLNNTDFVWTNVKEIENTNKNFQIEFSTSSKKLIYNGKIRIIFTISLSEKRYEDLPRLNLNPKLFHIQWIVDNVKIDKLKCPRLGLDLVLISSGKKVNTIESNFYDDEYSPGIFKDYKYVFGETNNDISCLHFKPIAYNSIKRNNINMLDIKQFKIVSSNNKTILRKNNLLNGYYGNLNVSLWNLFLTIGTENEDLYSNTNYTEFSFTLGIGDVPENSLSLFIKLIIILSTGLSLIVLLVFPISIYLIARKMKLRQNSALLNQDEIY